MNEGDKIVCVDNTHSGYKLVLTIDKIYTIHYISADIHSYHFVYDDRGRIFSISNKSVVYNPDRFISLEEHRSNKINILIK